MDLITTVSELMPAGKPDYRVMRSRQSIAALVQEYGRREMLKVIYLLIADFCNSLNVKRAMTEDQIVEAAAMLLDESGNYRLEEYALMFALAKRGKIGPELYQSVDILTIAAIEKSYDQYSSVQLAALQEVEDSARPEARKPDIPFPFVWQPGPLYGPPTKIKLRYDREDVERVLKQLHEDIITARNAEEQARREARQRQDAANLERIKDYVAKAGDANAARLLNEYLNERGINTTTHNTGDNGQQSHRTGASFAANTKDDNK
jgi:hypothetical protein